MKVIQDLDIPLAEDRRLIIRMYEVEKSIYFPTGIKFAFQYLFSKDNKWIEVARVDNYEHDPKRTGSHVHKLGTSKVEFKEIAPKEAEEYIIGLAEDIIKKLELYTVNWLITEFLPVLIIPVIILFQPEFRRALIKLGHSPFFRMFVKAEVQVAKEIVMAVTALSENKIGGLITIEREDGLDNYIEGGIKINSNISSDLISTIFWPGTPLHDGAIIIQELKIAAAGCLFPLTENENIPKTCGTRHRAGIGITEETDAISIIVSEETGLVSLAVGGNLKEDITQDELKKVLEEMSTPAVKGIRGVKLVEKNII